MICFYCEGNEATTRKFGESICEECDSKEISTSAPLHKMNERQKARAFKLAISAFKILKEEERILTKSTDPDELMNWLSKQAETINIQNHFKIDYNNFLERWKQLFGNTDNIPQSFKNNINAKFKEMRRL